MRNGHDASPASSPLKERFFRAPLGTSLRQRLFLKVTELTGKASGALPTDDDTTTTSEKPQSIAPKEHGAGSYVR